MTERLIVRSCKSSCTFISDWVPMILIDDLLHLSRPDLQDLCRTQEVRINLNTDQRALACAAVEQLSPELILMWWVNRELDGAMIDLGAAISGGMKRT